jgi:hypothetical protein
VSVTAALLISGGAAHAVVQVSPSEVTEGEVATIAFTVRDDRPKAAIRSVAIWPPGDRFLPTAIRAVPPPGFVVDRTEVPLRITFIQQSPEDGDRTVTLRFDAIPPVDEILFQVGVLFTDNSIDRWVDIGDGTTGAGAFPAVAVKVRRVALPHPAPTIDPSQVDPKTRQIPWLAGIAALLALASVGVAARVRGRLNDL